MTRKIPTALAAAVLLAAAAARAQEAGALGRAIQAAGEGRTREAALELYRIEESAAGEQRSQASFHLAQALSRMGFEFGAFFRYSQIIEAGPARPEYLKAVEGALRAGEAYGDEVFAPSVLRKAYNDEFRRLPPEVRARAHASIALLAYRAGKPDEAGRLLASAPPGSSAAAQAQYLRGLLQQAKEPEQALQTFRGILAMSGPGVRDLAGLQELAHLALGRTLFGLRRHAEASAEYAQLPRFSRHWDEALFEGAYADLLNGDPGGALGKLHSLHSPHLSDEFAPESQNLAAIIYQQNCLYPQVREVIARFDREYVPMQAAVKRILAGHPPVEVYWQMVAGGADGQLPPAVQHHLRKNERVASLLGYLAKLDGEAARLRADAALASAPLGIDLLDLLARQKALVGQVAGKFIEGRLADLVRLVDLLDADKEIIAFETTKGEKEDLEQNVDPKALLAAQRLGRPTMPSTGHEYWPFDGEYWPDEIGYYRYTLKNACAPKKEE